MSKKKKQQIMNKKEKVKKRLKSVKGRKLNHLQTLGITGLEGLVFKNPNEGRRVN